MESFKFTPEQCGRLKLYCVSVMQIEALERHSCFLGRAILCGKNPPRNDVAKKIESLRKHMIAAHEILTDNTLAGRNARAFLQSADEELIIDLPALMAVATVCNEAVAMLPSQTRDRKADPRIVGMIYSDLVSGRAKEHIAIRKGDGPSTARKLPKDRIELSSSPGSRFREIVCICYEAMTDKEVDPERAIKSFIRARKDQTRRQRAELGIGQQVEK